MSNIRVEFLGLQLWLAILLCLAFWGIIYLYYRKTTPPLSGIAKWLLIILRALALIIIFLALAQPVLDYTITKYKKKSLAILIDRSASMNLPVRPESESSRFDLAEKMLRDSEFNDLLSNMNYDYYAFAESLDVSRQGLNLDGNRTNPGQAFKQLEQLTAIAPPDYILLISDGRVTEGESLTDVVKKTNQPVYAIAVGDSTPVDDISLEKVVYDKIIYTGRETTIKSYISQRGSFSEKFRLSLYDGDRLLAEKLLLLPGDGKNGEFELPFIPTSRGRLFLDLVVSPNTDEANVLNNRQKFSVRVLKSKLRILVYSSSVNQEYGFLNRFLKSVADYEIVRVIDGTASGRLGERFPVTQEALNSFDLVILVDPDLVRLKSHYDRLASFISDRGGGLMVLMGREYLRSAANNRIADLIPLAVSTRPRSEPRQGQYRLNLNQRMIFHPSLGLGRTAEETMTIWANQPPFTSVIPVDSTRSSGVTLAYLEGDFDIRNMPAMALRRMQAGKVLAIAVSPFWHWAFLPIGVGQDNTPYQHFFGGSIRWLTIGDESDRINWQPVKEVFESGEKVIFAGIAHDEGFRPIENATGDLVISTAGGDSTITPILPDPTRPGHYLAEIGQLSEGNYEYRAELFGEGLRLGQFEGKFAVDEINREIALINVDWSFLENLSRATSGAFANYNDISPITEAINTSKIEVEEIHEIRIWDNIVLLIVMVTALLLEWFIRKNRQLL